MFSVTNIFLQIYETLKVVKKLYKNELQKVFTKYKISKVLFQAV
jgi:hypothetical protein